MSNPMTIGAFEAKTKFSELLERVSRGEEITITKHEKPVARPAPQASCFRQPDDEASQLRSQRVFIHQTGCRRRCSSSSTTRRALAAAQPLFPKQTHF